MNENRIKVLWIDDDPDGPETFADYFHNKGIDLEFARTSEEGILKLSGDGILQWGFVIIDGRGLNKHVALKTAGTTHIINKIAENKHIKEIPYCVLTGYKDSSDLRDLRSNHPNIKIWGKEDIMEDEGRDQFIEYIKEEESKIDENMLLHRHHDVFNALGKLNKETGCNYERELLNLLKCQYKGDTIPRSFLNTFRTLVESVCNSLFDYNLIHDKLKNAKHAKVVYLCGEPYVNPKNKIIVMDRGTPEPLLPECLASILPSFDEIFQEESHPSINEINKEYIYSALFVVCSFIACAGELIEKYPDKEENKKRWYDLSKQLNKDKIITSLKENGGVLSIDDVIYVPNKGSFSEGDSVRVVRIEKCPPDKNYGYRYKAEVKPCYNY